MLALEEEKEAAGDSAKSMEELREDYVGDSSDRVEIKIASVDVTDNGIEGNRSGECFVNTL
jgi:hypothetical protein